MTPALLCLVIAITDGDTLKARCGEPGAYQQITVRIAAIDAPEKRQPFGEASRQHLAGLCFKTWARITPKDTDRYGRTVADVECRGRDAGQEQVRAGMAWVYERYAHGYGHLQGLQVEARAAGRGLWSVPGAVEPWEWRRLRSGGPSHTAS